MAKLHIRQTPLETLVQTNGGGAFYWKAPLLGLVAGSRSMTPFALLNWTKEPVQLTDEDSTLKHILNWPGLRFLTGAGALGEFVGDKLPSTPGRTSPGPFIGRVVIGALAGATLARRYKQQQFVGAILGAAGATAGTLLGYYARTALPKATGTPDLPWAIAEDALAVGLGVVAVQK